MASTSGARAKGRSAASAGPPRSIGVFIDGTWNAARTRTPTNVRKLFLAMREGLAQGRDQRKLYVSGVGTRPTLDAGTLADADCDVELARHLRRETPPYMLPADRALIGGATGMGTPERIRATYHFLCKHFRPASDDRVFLFGFSRGAFAARSLAGFVGHVGLLLADQLAQVERAYEIYERSQDAAQTELRDFLYRLTGQPIATPDDLNWLPTHFLGVWDTVAAMRLLSRQWFRADYTEYHQVECPPAVMIARHALALHELRWPFEPLLWDAGQHPDLRQAWFAGAHADVGGGYGIGEDGRADEALRWIAREAMACGLSVDPAATWWTAWEHRPAVHHEHRNAFLATWPMPRAWLLAQDAPAWRSHHFHRSALDYLRAATPTDYRFRLPHVNAALRRVDAEALPMAVLLRLNGQEIVS